jgi:hypothetical protein
MLCPGCHQPLPGGAVLCPNCGREVAADESVDLSHTSSTVPSTSSFFWQGVRRGSVFIGLSLLTIPFGPLLVVSLVELARGDAFDAGLHNLFFSGLIGSAVCLYLVTGASWRRQATATYARYFVRRYRWFLVAAAVLALVGTPWAIWQESRTDRAELVPKAHLQSAFILLRSGRPTTSRAAVRILAQQQAQTLLAPTVDPTSSSHAVSVAVGGGGTQLVLVSKTENECIAIVDNATTSTNSAVANAPVAAGIWHAAWTPRAGGPQACGASTLPKPDRYGDFGMLGGGSWKRGGW